MSAAIITPATIKTRRRPYSVTSACAAGAEIVFMLARCSRAVAARLHRASMKTISAPAAQADVTEYGLRRVLIVAGVMMAALMQTLDSTITNVALPTIQG